MNTSHMPRHDYEPVLRAIADGVCSVESLANRLDLNNSRTYQRLRTLLRAKVIHTAHPARGGKKAIYALSVPVDCALAMLSEPIPESDPPQSCALEQAWPVTEASFARVGHDEETEEACS